MLRAAVWVPRCPFLSLLAGIGRGPALGSVALGLETVAAAAAVVAAGDGNATGGGRETERGLGDSEPCCSCRVSAGKRRPSLVDRASS